jgi:hypothetical protein
MAAMVVMPRGLLCEIILASVVQCRIPTVALLSIGTWAGWRIYAGLANMACTLESSAPRSIPQPAADLSPKTEIWQTRSGRRHAEARTYPVRCLKSGNLQAVFHRIARGSLEDPAASLDLPGAGRKDDVFHL